MSDINPFLFRKTSRPPCVVFGPLSRSLCSHVGDTYSYSHTHIPVFRTLLSLLPLVITSTNLRLDVDESTRLGVLRPKTLTELQRENGPLRSHLKRSLNYKKSITVSELKWATSPLDVFPSTLLLTVTTRYISPVPTYQ